MKFETTHTMVHLKASTSYTSISISGINIICIQLDVIVCLQFRCTNVHILVYSEQTTCNITIQKGSSTKMLLKSRTYKLINCCSICIEYFWPLLHFCLGLFYFYFYFLQDVIWKIYLFCIESNLLFFWSIDHDTVNVFSRNITGISCPPHCKIFTVGKIMFPMGINVNKNPYDIYGE